MKKILFLSVIISIFLLFSGCASNDTQTPIVVTELVRVTEIVEVTTIAEVTVIVEIPVTVTSSPTPKNSPTPTQTPTVTPTPTNTPTPTQTFTPTATPNLAQTATIEAYGMLASPKSDGFYTVGIEILSGMWESQGNGTGCYWASYDSSQDINNNHYGSAGGSINIQSSDYEVEFDDCGTWVYVENSNRELQSTATENKGNGFFTVDVEIAYGRWESQGTGDGCYWARLDNYQDINANHYGNAGGSVYINQYDYEVEFSDCGTWVYIGP